MANLNENPVWEDGVYQYEFGDPLKGGPGEIDNWQGQALANRTAYLKAHKADINSPTFTGLARSTAPIDEIDAKRLTTVEFVKYLIEKERNEQSYPIGKRYEQHLNDPTPKEAGLPGEWEVWSHRADGYGLSSTALPAYTTYTAGANYAVGAYVMYHLSGDNWTLYKALVAVTAADTQIDQVKWEKFTPSVIEERRFLQGWTDTDFEIGEQIPDGPYAGWYVCEILVPGGKFLSVEGGNRPTFVDGGTQEDQIRDIPAQIQNQPNVQSAWTNGAFRKPASTGTDVVGTMPTGNYRFTNTIYFEPFLVVPTGPENGGRTTAERIYRRVS